MKKSILLFFIAFIFYNNAHSQITKGNWMIGGAASFRSSDYENVAGFPSKQTLLQLSGEVGYFIIDKFALGLKPGYDRTEGNNPRKIVNNYSVGPFARYYFLPVDRYVNIFSELSYQHGIQKTNQTSFVNNNNDFSGVGGLPFFLILSVALEFTLGYSVYLYNYNSGKVKSVIAGIGFHFHLEKDK